MIARMLRLEMGARVWELISTEPEIVGLGPRVDIDLSRDAISTVMYAEVTKHRQE
ncbi:hypothetical protein ACFLTG_01750 [Chloroflexota bacterium]